MSDDEKDKKIIPFKLIKNKIKKALGMPVDNTFTVDIVTFMRAFATSPMFESYSKLYPDKRYFKWHFINGKDNEIIGVTFQLFKGDNDAG